MSGGSNPSVDRELVGVLRYTKESDGSFRGEEHWRMLTHPDGSKTVIMLVRLDATQVSRSVTLRVAANRRPIEAYQSLWVGGEFRGSGHYWVDGNRLRANVLSPEGHLEQRVKVPDSFSWVTHPLGGDALHMWYYDREKGGVQSGTVYNTDTLGVGLGSILGRVHAADLELVGNETVEVPAGRFETERFLMDGRLEIWIEPERDLMVKMRSPARDRLYELVELAETPLSRGQP